jgi:hypothetical protein
MLPENIALLVGLTGDKATVVEKVLKGCPLDEALIALGKFWKLKVWFKQEQEVIIRKRRYLRSVHVFNKFSRGKRFFMGRISLCYCPSKSSRHGYLFPDINTIEKYEIVLDAKAKDEFRTYENFAKKFNTRFITEAEIQKLWLQKSAQTGERYRPSDFKRIGPLGLRLLENFLKFFADVNTEGKYYDPRSDGKKSLEQRYESQAHTGRDITIHHTMGRPFVYYSSESYGIKSNGTYGIYGLIANEKEFLHLEND